MSSLKSTRLFIDSKKKKKHKTKISSIEVVEPKEIPKPVKRSKVKPKKFSWNDYLKKEIKPRKLVEFNVALRILPIGTRVSYILNKTYEDKRTGETKNVYCNSGFYKGTIEVKSFSLCDSPGKYVVSEQMMISVGKNLYYIGNDDVKEFYVFMDQNDLVKRAVKQCKDNISDIRGKSLPHIKGGSRNSNPLLSREPSKRIDINALNSVRRKKANSLLH